MNAEVAKVPVEYIITTTSDWTMFELVEGGQWENLIVECVQGEDRLKRDLFWDNKTIRLDKAGDDEQPVVVYAKCILNIPKERNRSNLKYRITKGDRQSTVVTANIKGKSTLVMVNKEADIWGDGTNPKTFDSPVNDYLPDLRKDKVFIVHGRNNHQALLLNKHLNNLGIMALLFDDLPDKGKTIIEQIEGIQNKISYAFVILTPDDVGCLYEDVDKINSDMATLKTIRRENVATAFGKLQGRARQNVIFELGLFIGALGRENVCCLKQKDVKEMPSDISGVLYKEFTKDVSEVFHELREELGI